MSRDPSNDEVTRNLGRRAEDRRISERRLDLRRAADRLRVGSWDEQRTQFVTRYLFGALGLAYFNLVAINIVHVGYLVLITLYLLHAWWRVASPLRLRLAMLTDALGVSAAVFVDSNVMSPAYLLYLVITLGNGMRYGVRAFAEAAIASFALAALVLGLRIDDYLQHFSVTSFFFMLFVGIIVLYSYALMKNVDRTRDSLTVESHNDALTGLLNRRGLHDRAQTLFRSIGTERSTVAVLFADLDGFKAVNDAYGHDAGDRLLQEVARALGARLRGNDVVARFGGDEFIVILPDASLEQAAIVAKRLQTAAAEADRNAPLSLTIGIGLAPEHGSDLETVVKTVDAAMYQGKLVGGRGGICRADGVAVA
jgi:diguanylate cyclase (GGDEF)-like protein